jgi:dCTP deaminase
VIFSDHDIIQALKRGEFDLAPLGMDQIQPCSVDVRLARTFTVWRQHAGGDIDPARNSTGLTTTMTVPGDQDSFPIQPGQFMLGSTMERITMRAPNVAARIEGKSSLGRLGLLVHCSAGWIDPGFEGHLTLELSNINRHAIRLRPGMKIAQICFFQCTSDADRLYGHPDLGSHYQGQGHAVTSKSFQGFTSTAPADG